MMDNILEVRNLTKQYADFTLDHVSFSIPKGTIMGLIGENGAGKSTTINAILDLIHKDDGTVTFWGQELSSAKQLKEDIGVVFDGINFYETLTLYRSGCRCYMGCRDVQTKLPYLFKAGAIKK